MACITCTANAGAKPEQAYVRSGENGQALLFNRLGECYGVTPAHVLGGDFYASLVGGTNKAPQGDGDLLQIFGYDLALLRITGQLVRHCGGVLDQVSKLDDLLSSTSSGVILSINEDSSMTRRTVTLSDVGLMYIRVQPIKSDEQLFQGLSGSLLLVNDKPAGILMTVDPETGEGRALRYDRAIETLRPFFDNGPTPPPPDGTDERGSTLHVTVSSWSAPAIGEAYRAANLTDEAGSATVWYVKPEKFPLEVVIALPGEKPQIIQRLRLVGDGVTPKERLPRDFEILVSSRQDGSWLPVSSGTYFMNEENKMVAFAPTRARYVMLRIYSYWGDAEAVGLSGIEIPKGD